MRLARAESRSSSRLQQETADCRLQTADCSLQTAAAAAAAVCSSSSNSNLVPLTELSIDMTKTDCTTLHILQQLSQKAGATAPFVPTQLNHDCCHRLARPLPRAPRPPPRPRLRETPGDKSSSSPSSSSAVILTTGSSFFFSLVSASSPFCFFSSLSSASSPSVVASVTFRFFSLGTHDFVSFLTLSNASRPGKKNGKLCGTHNASPYPAQRRQTNSQQAMGNYYGSSVDCP